LSAKDPLVARATLASRISHTTQRMAPVNSAIALGTTAGSTALTMAADWHGRSEPLLPLFAVLGWFVAIAAALFVLGRHAAGGDAGWGESVRQGLRIVKDNKRYAALLLVMAAMGAYSAYVKVRQDDSGVLRKLVEALERVEGTVADTNEGVKVLVEKAKRPETRLADMGYDTSNESALTALSRGDVVALQLRQEMKLAPIDLSASPLNPLPQLLAAKSGDVAGALKAAALSPEDLDRPSTYFATPQDPIPEIEKLATSHGIAVVRDKNDMTEMGKSYLQGQPLVTGAQVPPLVLAVWKGRADAVQVMLSQKASPDTVARVDVQVHTVTGPPLKGGYVPSRYHSVTLEFNALAEARRLGKADIEGLLQSAGATAKARIVAKH
jgi:hypothetical protein